MEREGGRESVAVDAVAATDTVSQRRVAMEVAGLAVWGGAQRRTKLTDEQVPLFLSALASALPREQGTIGPKDSTDRMLLFWMQNSLSYTCFR